MPSCRSYPIAAALLLALNACVDSVPKEPVDASGLYRGLDDGDLAIMTARLQQTLESMFSGETATWQNDATGRSGTLRPVRTFRNAAGYYCRNFEESLPSAAAPVARVQTACRTPAGVWVIALDSKPQP